MNCITGTFLDEVTHDIPSQNWGPQEWAADFDAMKTIGIDTVILIRAGYRDRCVFDSKVLAARQPMLPAYTDLLDLFLTEAERCGMRLFLGTYDSGRYWVGGDPATEASINKAFTEEVMERYGHRTSLAGWYLSHEIDTFDTAMMDVYLDLSSHLRSMKALPVLISPYIRGIKQFDEQAIDLETHTREWSQVFRALQGHVDIVAFQDGHVSYADLPNYLRVNGELARSHGIETWSNVESFDRDMPIKFLPLDFRNLRYKIEQASAAGVEKIITFEFSHFMSPNSVYPAAHHLYHRYREWVGR